MRLDEAGEPSTLTEVMARFGRGRPWLAGEMRLMRLLIAYGREFVQPRPYKLDDLARASGMSISGVRTAYDDADIAEAARLTGAKLHRRPVWPPESEGAS